MSIGAIKEIRDTELMAEDKIKAAQQQAKEIILKAEEKAEKIIKEAVDSQIASSKSMVESAEKEAGIEAEAKRKQNMEICNKLKADAESRMDDAVKSVMERIVKLDGNS